MSCRTCKTPKWRGDPCLNPDCARNMRPTQALRARTLPITATAQHGFHALNQSYQATGYDSPIRNTRWVTAS